MSLSRVKFDNFGIDAAASGTRAKILSRHIVAVIQRYAVRLVSLAFFVGLWHVASTSRLHLGLVTFANVPAPAEVIDAFIALARSGKLVPHLFSSLTRVFAGFTIAAITGIGLGLAIARLKLAEDVFLPPLEILRPIPAVAWIPLAILMFPSAEASMIFITYTGALFPILLNTIHGVEGIDRRLVASARSLGAGRGAILWEVILPGAMPSIVTGLAIGMGTSWFCLVTAEMISGQFGIGYYTWESYTLQNYADIVVGMLVIGALGMASSILVRKIGAWLTPWHQTK
ncbi:ABC transporter permease [Methylocapsa sp. D3K7]|uniref:ABC transporter permease n=1 Tax=Methylocapsa sp. D3K7 TaxID=3041435 RepID=UPI00244EF69D|nr:ABC transporter permease [Methylocapsa sp. D3K7]WGJ14783.1 ABC transporter permease [Methylocapsa sp. D3K7]